MVHGVFQAVPDFLYGDIVISIAHGMLNYFIMRKYESNTIAFHPTIKLENNPNK